jgi:DNA-binding transcriptional regulator YiaG
VKEKTFAQKLRFWRGDKTQKEAAFELDVDVDIYRKWEQGTSEPHNSPSIREIENRMEDAK